MDCLCVDFLGKWKITLQSLTFKKKWLASHNKKGLAREFSESLVMQACGSEYRFPSPMWNQSTISCISISLQLVGSRGNKRVSLGSWVTAVAVQLFLPKCRDFQVQWETLSQEKKGSSDKVVHTVSSFGLCMCNCTIICTHIHYSQHKHELQTYMKKQKGSDSKNTQITDLLILLKMLFGSLPSFCS